MLSCNIDVTLLTHSTCLIQNSAATTEAASQQKRRKQSEITEGKANRDGNNPEESKLSAIADPTRQAYAGNTQVQVKEQELEATIDLCSDSEEETAVPDTKLVIKKVKASLDNINTCYARDRERERESPLLCQQQVSSNAGRNFFEMYAEIKSKQCNAQGQDAKDFYGHLRKWCMQKTKDPTFIQEVKTFDFGLIQDSARNFEKALKALVNAERRGDDDVCVYKCQLESSSKVARNTFLSFQPKLQP